MEDKQFEKEKERKLTAAEQKRFDRFTKICEDLKAKGYRQVDLTVGIIRANIFAIVLAIPVYVIGYVLFFWKNRFSGFSYDSFSGFIWFLVLYFALIFVHEGLHGITWAIFSENHLKDIEFGFMAAYLTPYCTCTTPLKKGPYILGALMPLIVLGILPTAAAIFTGSLLWLNVGLIMIVSAGGDILIVLQILRYHTNASEIRYYDHPTQAGGVIFER